MIIRILLFGFWFLSAPEMTKEISSTTDPGFTEGIFDSQTIKDLLDRRDCDGIRFYNTMGSDGKVRVMAVSVSEEADMNSNILIFKPYVVSLGLVENRINVDKISKSKARDFCQAVDLSPHTQYSALFKKSDLESLLRNADCNALKIMPAMASEKLSMEVHAVNVTDGLVTDLGRGAGFDLLDTDPCPPVCGVSTNYVYFRN